VDAVVRLIERGSADDAAHVTHSGRGMQQIAHETVAQVRIFWGCSVSPIGAPCLGSGAHGDPITPADEPEVRHGRSCAASRGSGSTAGARSSRRSCDTRYGCVWR
jgi:hypothetical protein